MKKLLVALLALALLLSFGCRQKIEYRTDVSCAAITAEICDELSKEDAFLPFGEDHVRFSFENTDRFADKSLVYSAPSENIDEIGVFRADSDEDVEELRRLCEQYVTTLREDMRAFVESYAPREAQKLDRAEVKVFGHYVVYTVLDDADRAEAYEEIEELLKK